MDFIPALRTPVKSGTASRRPGTNGEQWATALEAMRLDGNFGGRGLIVARLKSRFTDPVQVLTRRTSGAKSLAQWCPAVFVMFDGVTKSWLLPDGKANRGAKMVDQLWTCLRRAQPTDPISGSAVRVDAGALLDTLTKALLGWQPNTQFRWMQLQRP